MASLVWSRPRSRRLARPRTLERYPVDVRALLDYVATMQRPLVELERKLAELRQLGHVYDEDGAVWLRYGTPEARSAYDGASFWVAEDGSLCVKVTTLADGAERPAARDIALSDPEIAVLREIVGEP